MQLLLVGTQRRTTMLPSVMVIVVVGLLLSLLTSPSLVAVNAFTAVQTTTRQQHHPAVLLTTTWTTRTTTTARAITTTPVTTKTTKTRLYMGWGPDPIWSPAVVVSNVPACPNGRSILLRLSVPSETAASFTTPGQYVQVKTNTDDTIKPAFLAICSAPDPENAYFDFLIKKTDANAWLTSLAAGDVPTTLQISQVLGKGYAVQENLEGFKYDFPTQNIILAAAGSGLAPLASAIESGQLGTGGPDSSRTCTLYYGERTVDDLCFVDRFAYWQQSCGVTVVPVLSQPDSFYTGRQGYVQTALAEDGIPIPRNSGALLCGMKGMTESVKNLLINAGVFEGRILFNF
jgi:NAD(P)H-flavin reductase